MKRVAGKWLWALNLMLCLAVAAWSIKLPTRHDTAFASAQNQTPSQTIAEDHSHTQAFNEMWQRHGHGHDLIDHDHSTALAPVIADANSRGLPAKSELAHRGRIAGTPLFSIKKPPRVWMS
ncbi:hypothetical protein [Pseudophaeobacter sp.]|uniref:hypothetical protein n=1 Tax=Pseudophaeobacter sp. TaxID=1971739 RepID=UPI0032968A9D